MLRHLPLVLLAATVAASAPAEDTMPKTKSKPKTCPLPVLQTIAWSGVPHAVTINGFPDDALRSITSTGDAGEVDGFETRMQRYLVLHPYFLRAEGNRLMATYRLNGHHIADDDAGPWRLDLRMALVDWPGMPVDQPNEYRERELARFVSPDLVRADDQVEKSLTGTFAWSAPLPVWSWTSGIAIEDSEKTKTSLYVEYRAFHAELVALRTAHLAAPDSKQPPAMVAALRASMREFIQASELRGVPYTLHEELAYAAQHWSLRDYDLEMAARAAALAKLPKLTPEQERAEAERKLKEQFVTVVAHDTPVDTDPEPDADGKLPPRLTLAPLPDLADVKLTLLGDGTLARLTVADTDAPLVSFFSNYADGPWGSRYSTKLQADIWFRRDASGRWVVDALWPQTSAIEKWGTLDDLLDGLHY